MSDTQALETDDNLHQVTAAEEAKGIFILVNRWTAGFGLAVVISLFLSSRYSYLLFHTMAELFSVVVAFSIFIIAWNARRYIQNGYLLFVGIAYLAIGFLDLLHTLGYSGMPVFPGYNFVANQLWIAARFLESLALLLGFAYLSSDRRPNPAFLIGAFAFVTGLAIASIFVWRIFPVCFVAGQGQTRFKILSEYVIIAILLVDAGLLVLNRAKFQRGIYQALLGATLLAVLTEVAFTMYVNNFDLSNMVGHFLKVFSFYLIYVAIVKNGVEQPYEMVFRELAEANKRLSAEVEAHRATQGRFRRTFEGAPIGAAIVGLDKRFQRVNPALCSFLGYSADELLHLTFSDVTHPEDLPFDLVKVNELEMGATDRYEVEKRYIRKDGCIVWGHLSLKMLTDEGSDEQYMLPMIVDITERKLIEAAAREKTEMIQLLLHSTSEAIYGVDHDGLCTFCNQAFLKLFGYDRQDQVLGRNMHEVIHHTRADGGSYPVEDCPIYEAYLVGRETHIQDEVLWRADGSSFHAEYWSHPLYRNGSIEGAVVTCLDITERRRVESEKAELEYQGHQLRKAESLAIMAGSVAHHFNNKLQSVVTALEMLDPASKPEDTAKYLTRARLAAIRAAEVSQSMLIYLGQTTGELEPRLLAMLCHDSLPFLQSSLPSHVTLDLECPSHGPVVRASEESINQILTALVSNAWEAMGVSGGHIRLRLTTCPAEAIPQLHRFPIGWQAQSTSYACLEVADTGCGIPEADLEKVFDPFFSTKFAGRGLGLPMVMGLVQAHGGVIVVESKLRQGSVFRVFLPVSAETPFHHAGTEIQPQQLQCEGMILLADDDLALLEAAGELIEHLGFTVLTAKDGVDAVEQFRKHKDDIRCVITDLTMPRMDGWETLSALRRLEPNLPVILSSGYDKAQVMATSHVERPQAFLGKPYFLKQLQAALVQALRVEAKQHARPEKGHF